MYNIWQRPSHTKINTREKAIIIESPDDLDHLNRLLLAGWIIRSERSITPINDAKSALIIIEDGGMPASQIAMMVDADEIGVMALNNALQTSGRSYYCGVAIGSKVIVVLEDVRPIGMVDSTCIF